MAVQHRLHDIGIEVRANKVRAAAALSADTAALDADASCLLQVDSSAMRREGAGIVPGAAPEKAAAAAAPAEAEAQPAAAKPSPPEESEERGSVLEMAAAVEAVLHEAKATAAAAQAVAAETASSSTPRAASLAEEQATSAENAEASRKVAETKETTEASPKSSLVLLLIELFPITWILGLNNFYLGNIGLGIAKLLVSVFTLGLGGLIWGGIDFIAIIANALAHKESIHVLGMNAQFEKGMADKAYAMAVLDLAMLPCWMALAWGFWSWRKRQRLEALRQNAMKSSHYGQRNSAAAPGERLLTHGG